MEPVTHERIATAGRYLSNAEIAAVACREAGLPFFVACALLEKESGGRNVFGHDAGGLYAGLDVTPERWKRFRHKVVDQGHTSNGVGPCQITYRGFFPDMEKQGLKPYDAHDNMLYGFRLLAGYEKATGSWEGAGTRYNGSPQYGRDFDALVKKWHDRLHI